MEKVFVCESMYTPNSEKIIKQARQLGYLLAESGVQYIQGGCAKGLMGETLKAFLTKSKNVRFVIPEKYFNYDAPELEELVGKENFVYEKVSGEAGRLIQIKEADRIIVLPGGLGTLEELLYVNETARAGEHAKQIDLVNIDGYYDGFLQQVNTSIEQGLSKPSVLKFNIVKNVSQLKGFQKEEQTTSNNRSKIKTADYTSEK